ncbi:hypothetical protein ACD589_15535 [Rhizobium sp. 814_E9_N1_1]|uniref:hypothetical protein n=1 Tax=unclassified Rhizobium TaxID=2613769 RepID=UPI003F28004C
MRSVSRASRQKGVLSAIQSSQPADVPAVADIKVVLVDSAFHDIDSSASTFEIVSRAAFLEALRMTKLGSVPASYEG